MPTKILITGASGFLGSVIATYLSNPSHDIAVETVGRGKTATYQTDLGNGMTPVVKKYDMVIHAAGKAHMVPSSPSEEQEFFRVNFEGTKHLCQSFDPSHMPGAFIFISTVAVYGQDAGELISEESPLNGSTPYARSKIRAEQWLQQWASNNGVTLTILRLPLIAGPNPPGNLGDMIKGIRSGRYLSIGKADARKSIVWAEDIAAIIPKAAAVGGIYNLTDGRHPSFGQLERCIAGALHKRYPRRIPTVAAQSLAVLGDLLGERFPINSGKLKKILSSLTFDDRKANRQIQWNPSDVIEKLATII